MHVTDLLERYIGKETFLISVIGAGGKTTFIYQMAKKAKGKRPVIVTTTTMMYHPGDKADSVVYRGDKLVAESGKILSFFSDHDRRTGKVTGITKEEANSLKTAYVGALILNEADGSKRKPLKLHAEHEPVIPSESDMVVLVIGLDALGKEASDALIHRYELYREEIGSLVIDEDVIVRIIKKNLENGIPEKAKVIVILNKADGIDRGKIKNIFGRIKVEEKIDMAITCEMKEDKLISYQDARGEPWEN